jgi:hypothetical protein
MVKSRGLRYDQDEKDKIHLTGIWRRNFTKWQCRICLFIYCLFNDAVSISEYMISNIRMINEWWFGKNVGWRARGFSRHYPGIRLEELRKPRTASIKTVSAPIDTWTESLQNTIRKFCRLSSRRREEDVETDQGKLGCDISDELKWLRILSSVLIGIRGAEPAGL